MDLNIQKIWTDKNPCSKYHLCLIFIIIFPKFSPNQNTGMFSFSNFISYHEIRTHWKPLTIFYFPHAQFRGHVIVSSFVPYAPSHINHLKLNYSNDSLVPSFSQNSVDLNLERIAHCGKVLAVCGRIRAWYERNQFFKVDKSRFGNTGFNTLQGCNISVTCAFCTINFSNISHIEKNV